MSLLGVRTASIYFHVAGVGLVNRTVSAVKRF